MKIKYLLLFFGLFFLSCKNEGAKKPTHLIEEEKMVDILYDISILEAIRSSNPGVLGDNSIDAQTYIYQKYGIDSLQFLENTAYYASDFKKFRKMYEEVENRIAIKKVEADSLLKKKQEEDNKRAIELRSISKDSLKARKMEETTAFSKKKK
ncbi:DUF4296 domain-containing protein [Flavobacterium sp.]|uniref:DUF4296 domain-containing protein n=1 Tax=Flavobacterium sp. TaxID=239 RepID=UPI0035297BAB